MDSFDEAVEMGFQIEQTLIDDGTIKLNNDKYQKSNSNNKTPFWVKNKNVVNDRVVDAKKLKHHHLSKTLKVHL